MGQADILEFLRNKRLTGDESFFSIHEIAKGLNGGSPQYHNIRKSLYNLVKHNIVEVKNAGDVFEWYKTFRINEKYLEENPGSIDIWLGGHTHTNPDDRYGGKTHIEGKWGTTFINVAAMSKYHAGRTTMPMSRLLTFNPGRDTIDVGCYLHTSDYSRQGWYDRVAQEVSLRHRFAGI